MIKKRNLKFLGVVCLIITISWVSMFGNKVQAQKTTKLTMWTMAWSPLQSADEISIKEFEEQNPNIKITYQFFPYDTFFEKLLPTLTVGGAPNIIGIWGGWELNFNRAGLMSEVPSTIATPQEIEETYWEPAIAHYRRNGRYYGIPREYNQGSGGLVIYLDMFKEAGLEPSFENWDEIISKAKKLVRRDEKGNITRAGLGLYSIMRAYFHLPEWIYQHGGKFWAEDEIHVNLDTPLAVKGMKFLRDLLFKHKVSDVRWEMAGLLGRSEGGELFDKRLTAMYKYGPFFASLQKKEFPERDIGYIPLPSFTDSPFYWAADTGWGLAVPRQSRHQEVAWEFVKYATSKENALRFSKVTMLVPGRKDLQYHPELMKMGSEWKVAFDIMPYGRSVGDTRDYDKFVKILDDNTVEMWFGKKTAEEATKAIHTQINKMLDEHIKMYGR